MRVGRLSRSRSVGFGGGLEALAGEGEHVDQPAWPAGDVPGFQQTVDFVVDSGTSVDEEVLADSE